MFQKLSQWFMRDPVNRTITLILLIIVVTIFIHARFNRSEGLVVWDIKSYYAYLPATFIYHDLSFGFMDEDPEKFGKWIWPFETPTGQKAVRTTMGQAFLYTPFFTIGHLVALITPYEADGYSRPYQVALNFSALFYVWLGMLFLVKILRRHFAEKVIALTLFAVVIGTNLFYYTTTEAPMTHAFSFGLFAVFLWLTTKFYDKPSLKYLLLSGALAGLVTLIRPTNIIILLVFFLWDIRSFKAFNERMAFFIKKTHWVLLMALAFVLVWVPQFIYWYNVSGKVFYFTYGEKGDGFFFNNPQIFNILFSYKKGWLVYTPIMLFALAGLFMLPRRVPGTFLALLLFKILNIYILSSWWSWWFGGGFGLRAFVESYALLALPLAAFVDFGFRQKKLLKIPILGILIVLILFNQFQTRQYNNNAIHWWWMNKEAYWETFLKLHPTQRFWVVVTLPDYEAAREGIYREIRSDRAKALEARGREWVSWKKPIPEHLIKQWLAHDLKHDTGFVKSVDSLETTRLKTAQEAEHKAKKLFEEKGYAYWDRYFALEFLLDEMKANRGLIKRIEEKAEEAGITFEEQLLIDANWLLDNERD